jgi:hypothetical protein
LSDHYWSLQKKDKETIIKHACPWLGMRVDLILSRNSDSKPRGRPSPIQNIKNLAYGIGGGAL